MMAVGLRGSGAGPRTETPPRAWAARPAVLLAAALLGGCFTIDGHFGTPIPREPLEQIQDGVTTRQQIQAWFGPPSAFYRPNLLSLLLAGKEEISIVPRQVYDDVLTYQYIESSVSVIFCPLLFVWIDGRTASDTLVVFFDDDGIVRYHAFRRDRDPTDEAKSSPEARS